MSEANNNPEIKSREPETLKRIEVFSKLLVGIAGVGITVLGYMYQDSSSKTALLIEQEKADTEIRAQMFGKITDRLMLPNKESADSLEEDTLLAQVLALNFHELIELKPLMLSLDQKLQRRIDEENSGPKYELLQKNLRSIARRVRDRQVSALINRYDTSSQQSGKLQYVNVSTQGDPKLSKCAVSENEGYNISYKEALYIPDIHDKKYIQFSLVNENFNEEKFEIALNTNVERAEPVRPKSRRQTSNNTTITTALQAGLTEFEVTNYDLPYTDNMLTPDGRRYAIFIDDICSTNSQKSSSNSVRFGILYFPEDYYPSRGRPTSYEQLGQKLAWSE